MSLRWISCALTIFVASIAAAQTTLPDIQPSTQPAPLPPTTADQSTPHGAIEVWLIANARNDGDSIRSVLYAANPSERRMIYALAAEADASRRLEAAKRAAFPTQYKDLTPEIEAGLSRLVPLLNSGQDTITGDKATYLRDARSTPVFLLKYQGQWCLPIASIFTPHDPASLEYGHRMIDAQVKATEMGIAELESGKFVSLTEAQDTINNQISEARAEAQTQPAPSP